MSSLFTPLASCGASSISRLPQKGHLNISIVWTSSGVIVCSTVFLAAKRKDSPQSTFRHLYFIFSLSFRFNHSDPLW